MPKTINFTGKYTWNQERDSMSFEATVDGKKTPCLISREALEDHYGADQSKTVDQAFSDNQFEIEDAARKIINKGQVDSHGEYLIQSQDV
ncbi:MAG: DUF1488 domain-containing protein [Methylobacter sp.]|nr:DUF1488 domain-containing protein [Methylobacter sp.]